MTLKKKKIGYNQMPVIIQFLVVVVDFLQEGYRVLPSFTEFFFGFTPRRGTSLAERVRFENRFSGVLLGRL